MKSLIQYTCMSCGRPADMADDEHDDPGGLCVRCYDDAVEIDSARTVFREVERECEIEASIEVIGMRT